MTLDDELANLDIRIRKLKTQFDLFFSGAIPKPPLDFRDDLDRDIKRVGNTREMKLAQRFLYNTILNRWNVFSELWGKRLAMKEEGERLGPVARRRRGPDGAAPASEPSRPRGEPRMGAERDLVARICIRDVNDSPEQLQTLYRAFIDAKEKAGEASPRPTFEKFRKEIERHAAAIRQKSSCERVDFRLYLQDNKVSLKAKPLKQEDVT